jgi:hypothetical protein
MLSWSFNFGYTRRLKAPQPPKRKLKFELTLAHFPLARHHSCNLIGAGALPFTHALLPLPLLYLASLLKNNGNGTRERPQKSSPTRDWAFENGVACATVYRCDQRLQMMICWMSLVVQAQPVMVRECFEGK